MQLHPPPQLVGITRADLLEGEELGQVGYWDTFWDKDDVFYGHVLGAKGMERRAVVLCVNETGTMDASVTS